MYAYGVARPKAEDPSEPITLRLPGSVLRAWEAKAAARGVSARVLIQEKLTAAVEGERKR